MATLNQMKENVIFPHKRVGEGRTLMKTNGDNIPRPPPPHNHSPLGHVTPGTKYVLLSELDGIQIICTFT